MTQKDIKEEARKKLALNMHQAIVIYTVEFTVFITLVALVVMSCVCLQFNKAAAIVMICYGILLGIIALVASGMVSFAMVDFYLAAYRCKPYNIRRIGDTLARSGITKIFILSLRRTLLALLLLLCLIVPGVIYLIRTSMAHYLLIANPKMKASTALTASNKVMSGKTGAYFSLCMSLVGWYLLGILTLGLGFIFIKPYTNLIKATYYKRNLQGDKTVYNIVAQPISPPQENTVQIQQNAQNAAKPMPAQTPTVQIDVKNVEKQPAPIDALAEEDVIDMNAAMRDFGSPEVVQEVKEVPIAVTVNSGKRKTRTAEAVPSTPPEPQSGADGVRVIEGTGIVETERVLSTEEIHASEKARKQVIDNMYTNTHPNKSKIDYVSGLGKQRPDSFVTTETDEFVTPEQNSSDRPIDGTPVEHVISDSEFDEFLRNFDKETIAEAVGAPAASSAVQEPKIDESATPVNPVRHAADRHAENTAHERNAEISDRVERLKREREERLKNKK